MYKRIKQYFSFIHFFFPAPVVSLLISGQSIIIGEIEATTEHEEATIIADIDYSRIEERRMNMPFAKQRHGDLYQLVDISRAVDNQVYVATCSPARDINAGYVAWGHSTLVSPFGDMVYVQPSFL